MDIVIIVLKVLVALILLKVAYAKLSGMEGPKKMFAGMGMEPAGRILLGLLELAAAIFIFVPGLVWIGAAIAIVLTVGAVVVHVFKLGIDKLFFMAIFVLAVAAYVFYMEYQAGMVPTMGG